MEQEQGRGSAEEAPKWRRVPQRPRVEPGAQVEEIEEKRQREHRQREQVHREVSGQAKHEERTQQGSQKERTMHNRAIQGF